MTALALSDRPATGGYKVDISRGQNIGRVSSEWFSRPDDERFLSLGSLHDKVRARADLASTRIVESRAIRVAAHSDAPERLRLIAPGSDVPVAPTHWSFGQLCSLVGAPSGYLRDLPAALAGINLQHGLIAHRGEHVKLLETRDGRTELRAVTGPDYGRIWDHELVEAVMGIAGNGTGDTRWKVPGVLDWGSMVYNPCVDISAETTTLYASDRDVFLFLVDDTHPIEAGKLPNGDPDLYFRGFYCWNSEVGAKSLGIATFYLRAVCMNRNLWGVENFEEISIRHSKFAASRFATQAAPALAHFADSSPGDFIQGIRAARERIIARKDEDRENFLRNQGFSKVETGRIIASVLAEEGHPPASLYDFVQGITAVARTRTNQDARLELEGKAKRILQKSN
ncbi:MULTISPECIES: DUF932 domain-containing protein [Sphingobium]|jgi:hypothetical protein|uniref:DUF932 domain-containing protein n=1 Tax=Sphingobium limneticum TaxID=1007511 RepID=A0A5J5HRH5_9SPHN|nr:MULTISPECIES: DUF932 domain-containing protein [Sphingobium]KAA9011634.1 DUF932 domain-containing protein [Sphingobium limneticum]KAA9012254.1 DUF932 domain-containing protein [Sphingobium limneticum]KAA9024715.1 DUF932 domain-containing protein [Sphingobium limneticum]BBD03380.1 hypothetical protein YGS_C2P1394 [Sphingobium sp. YG1]